MILHIDTSNNKEIVVFLENNGLILKKKKMEAKRNQSEKLLPAIEALLLSAKINFKDLVEIKVENSGESFTSLRVGILTANALAYALKIKVSTENKKNSKKHVKKFDNFNIVTPDYKRSLDIALPKKQ
ncbi:hypothetical protein CVU82_02430 [Candidatus Falkowbacteria bacterium HGW-Falkowbacteria-1]|jgi:tRNA threonylcarbamoyladenosine biosynthesis protein TsaB|uniref:Gcp-like domain-containing protein n=1 Tax=Candidatus Falkowbacteria bacterium HGW-Falkowbacteria-1 TaxID=2013768 RepID=A0A2N2E9R1_9BACT|nr:MAG: hypothetical protein CVU82_02430 [Candidatus Falkowbacteria bacterium HGW-Falkowbacteria-1]